jgi:restriction endonuclease Mrr
VRDFYGALVHDGEAVRGYIVTTTFFSRAAREWTKGKPIDLVDGKKLVESVPLIG